MTMATSATTAEGSRRLDPAAVALAVAALALGLHLYLGMLGATPLQRGNEAGYAFPPIQMLDSGDYLVTSYQGEHFLDKPSLSHWIVALSYRLFGVSVFAARLPSAVAGLATILIVGLWVRRRSGDTAGALAALILMFSFEFVFVAMTFAADAFLTLAVVVAILALDAAARRPDGSAVAWGARCGAALAFAFFFKGLVGIVLPVGAVATALLLERRRPADPVRRGAWTLLILVALIAPWHVAMAYRLGDEFWRVFYWQNQLLRGATDIYMSVKDRGPFFYAGVLAWAIFPWSLHLAGAAPERRSSKVPLAWLVFGLVFLSVLVMKREVYLATLLPAASALVAEGFVSDRRASPFFRRIAWGLAAATAAAAFLVSARSSRHLADLAGSGATLGVSAAFLVLAAVLTWAALRPRSVRVLFATALACAVLCLSLRVLDERLGRLDPLPEWGARVNGECREGCDGFLLGPSATSLAFYSRMDWVRVAEPWDKLPGLMRHRKGFLLMLTSKEGKLESLPLKWQVVERRTSIGTRSANLLLHPEDALESLSLVRIEAPSAAAGPALPAQEERPSFPAAFP
jgi:4-amino-4-deoxy-L-arabinose transferase-like glycosyltransferase